MATSTFMGTTLSGPTDGTVGPPSPRKEGALPLPPQFCTSSSPPMHPSPPIPGPPPPSQSLLTLTHHQQRFHDHKSSISTSNPALPLVAAPSDPSEPPVEGLSAIIIPTNVGHQQDDATTHDVNIDSITDSAVPHCCCCGPPLGARAQTHQRRGLFRCGRGALPLPLFVCMLIPAIVLSIIFTAVVWTTLNRSAVNSVETLVARLHHFVAQDLSARIIGVFAEMDDILGTWAATTPGNWDHNASFTQRQMISILDSRETPYAILLARGDNYTGLFVKRTPSGEIQAGEYFPPGSAAIPTINASVNLSGQLAYWNLDADHAKKDFVQSVPYVPSTRAWYAAALHHNGTSLSKTYMSASDGRMVITISRPAYEPSNGKLAAIFGVSFIATEFQKTINDAYQALETSGMVILIDNGGGVIASVTSSPTSTTADIGEAQTFARAFGEDLPEYVRMHTFQTFGESFVLKVNFCEKVGTLLCSSGFNWSLIAILPTRDYYSRIRNNNVMVAVYTGIYLTIFITVIILCFHFVVKRPLTALTAQIFALKEAVLHQDTVAVRNEAETSCFSEIRNLQHAVVDALGAVESEMKQRAELQQQRAEEEARGMLHEKDMFLATISHEMRTPLTACIGMAEILLETTKLDHRQHECAETISSNGSMLLSLVNDLLDYRKLEAGKLEIESLPFCPRECVERAARVVQARAEDKGLELVIHVRANVPQQCIGDSSRLSQVLLNLLSNAVKFTPAGLVVLMCSQSEDFEWIQFAVIDTGIGLDDEAIGRLFQPFVQADASMSRRFGGTGLGLVISRKLVELMGGRLSVASAGSNQGSEFRFALPCVIPHTSGSSLSLSRTMTKPLDTIISEASPILVIDHIPERQAAVGEMLRTLTFPFVALDSPCRLADVNPDCEQESSSDRAIAHSPLVIIHSRPDMDLPSLLRAGLKMGLPLRRVILIVNISGDFQDLPNVIRICKPLTLSKLSTAITASLSAQLENGLGVGGGAGPASSTESGSPEIMVLGEKGFRDGSSNCSAVPPHRGCHPTASLQLIDTSPRILVVDDVIVNQRVLMLKLQQRGYTNIDLASSGLEALEAVQKSPFVYSCILMDVMMPGMDGLEATRRIRMDGRYASVPIIGVTGNCTPSDFRRCLDAGMVEALGKPIDSDRLFNVLERHMVSAAWATVGPFSNLASPATTAM